MKRWPKGTWMKLKDRDVLRAFVGPAKKMSGRRLAKYAEVHPSFIDHLLSGRRQSCTPRTAQLIAEALDVPLGVLFDPTAPSVKMEDTKREKVAA